MWNDTAVTKLLGIDYPVFQGPFGGNLSSVDLVATISNAGGLGGYGAYSNTPQEIIEIDRQIKSATNKGYNLNLWVSDTDVPNADGTITDEYFQQTAALFKPYFDEAGLPLPEKPAPFHSRFENQLQLVLDLRPKVFSYMFGTLSPEILEECRRRGIITAGAATTPDEAIALEATGTDMIIASGFEAGGHRPSFLASAESSTMGSFVLLQLIREKVKVPVIAAGGIATGKGIAAALTLGADAVQIGTAFLACDESGAPPSHREMLFSDHAKYTSLTRAFTGRLGRGISNRITKALQDTAGQFLPFPLQTQLMSPLRKASLEKEKWDMVFFWGGQIAPLLKHRKAGELMRALVEETNTFYSSTTKN
ncbi:NAD(P)H-dependent flavin oxidoreductase [Chitinophaga varians]|uniref:NAD(P)H-dependent flavin oxidoreductase n=1 Tax=Chitinophaga varians TaxID=2202339 RepID=UPI00165EF50F|nr:nitronate monooxygenase [Chitinophaga varians]MBC9914536.1 nitronate monooxygenase [Chitinophaga varians]